MPEVIVIGGANVDIKGRSRAAVMPGTSNPGEVIVSPGGVGRNIAENLARLDVSTALLAMTGDDANGRLLREATAAAGVDTSLMRTSVMPTGTYLAVLDADGELVAAVNDMRAAEALDAGTLHGLSHRLAGAAMLVADCNIPVDSLAWLCGFAHDTGVPLVIEPVSVPKAAKLLALGARPPVFAITPNLQQLEALTGQGEPEAALERLHRLGFVNIVAHAGRAGAIVSDGRSAPCRIPAFPVDGIADVTGAGDAAVAGLVCGLTGGLALADAARLGQAAASLKLRSPGSVTAAMNRDRVLALANLPKDN